LSEKACRTDRREAGDDRATVSVCNQDGASSELEVSSSETAANGLQSWQTSFDRTAHSARSYNGDGQSNL